MLIFNCFFSRFIWLFKLMRKTTIKYNLFYSVFAPSFLLLVPIRTHYCHLHHRYSYWHTTFWSGTFSKWFQKHSPPKSPLQLGHVNAATGQLRRSMQQQSLNDAWVNMTARMPASACMRAELSPVAWTDGHSKVRRRRKKLCGEI